MKELQEITKEKWEQLRTEVIQQARKLAGHGDINWYYTAMQIFYWKFPQLKQGAKVMYPRGHSKWTIRHFSLVGCRYIRKFAKTPVTCLLRSPDGRHYVSEHLPGFCPIHQLIAVNNKAK